MDKNFGVRVRVFKGKAGRLVEVEKWFATDKARSAYVAKAQDSGNLYEVSAYCDLTPTVDVENEKEMKC